MTVQLDLDALGSDKSNRKCIQNTLFSHHTDFVIKNVYDMITKVKCESFYLLGKKEKDCVLSFGEPLMKSKTYHFLHKRGECQCKSYTARVNKTATVAVFKTGKTRAVNRSTERIGFVGSVKVEKTISLETGSDRFDRFWLNQPVSIDFVNPVHYSECNTRVHKTD